MKKTFNMFITARPSNSYENDEDGIHYEAWDMDMTGDGRAIVMQTVLEVDLPDDDLRPKFIAALREEQQEIRADAEYKVTQIEERIQSLLAIEGPK